jgi:DNA-binding response OmpR family regulator
VVLDIMLPKKDGISIPVAYAATASPRNLTACTVEDKTTGLDAGADDYLPKPFAFDS